MPVHASQVSKKCQKKCAAALRSVTSLKKQREDGAPEEGEEPQAEERNQKKGFLALALPVI
jgi:hypothetical protein